MQTIPIARYDYTMLVDFNYGEGDDLYHMDMVYLNPFRKSPAFDSKLCRINDKDIKNIHIGDVGIYVPEKIIPHTDWTEEVSATWKKEFDYQNHNFELATVLVFGRYVNIFGTKIGEQAVSLDGTGISCQRGDDLLIRIKDHHKYEVVRNIKQELLKYNLQQQMAKKL